VNLPDDFDVSIYKELNPDVINNTDIEVKVKYNKYGFYQNRFYKNNIIYKIPNNFNNNFYTKIIEFADIWEKDNLEYYPNIKNIYTYDLMYKFYTCVINFYFEKNSIKDIDNILKILDFSYPKRSYDILEVINIDMKKSVDNIFDVDLLKVHDTDLNIIKYVMYPFLTYPTIEKEIFYYENKTLLKIRDYNIINLEHRHDNMEQILDNIKNIKWLNPIRFNAIKSNKGYVGCLSSHIEILKKYFDTNENVLIVEDDNIIIDDDKLFNILNILDSEIFQWDIYLGTISNITSQLKGVKYVNNIEFLNVVNFTKTNFVYYNKKIIPQIINLEKYHNEFNSRLKYIDRYLNLFNVFTSYNICMPHNKRSEIESIFDSNIEKYTINLTYSTIKKEELLYNKLPKNFNSCMYKNLNIDLINIPDFNAKIHYIENGISENRSYNDNYFDYKIFNRENQYLLSNDIYLKYLDDIRQVKNDKFQSFIKKYSVMKDIKYIFLVNHDYSLFGANHYLYILFKYLNDIYKDTNIKILLCEINYNIELLHKYSISNDNVIEYKNDPTLLYMLYEKFQPKIIYLNSCNFAMYKIYKYLPRNKTIFHSHEIFDDYLLSKLIIPDFVVSNRITEQYIEYYKSSNNIPNIQRPFIINPNEIQNLANENIGVIKNKYQILDEKKITIGMCGQIADRKNYKLFLEISKNYPDYNFMWIGDNADIFDMYKNIYHIKHTNNPYKYYKQYIDYFILFSIKEPFGFVVVENIILETPTITFAKNIYCDHKHDLTKDFYFEYPDEINFNNCIDAINKFVISKKSSIISKNGLKYIENFFNKPSSVYIKINEILNI
jgi:hypothetical protein